MPAASRITAWPPPTASEKSPTTLQLVAELAEAGAHRRRHPRLDVEVAAGKARLGEARRFHGGLDVHAVVDDVRHELRMGLGLVESAHDAEGDADVAMGHQRGNDRVQRALAAGELVGMAGLEGEQRAAIVQDEAAALDGDAGAEQAEIALDQRHHVAVAVDGREIGRVGARDRAACRGRRCSWPWRDRRACARSRPYSAEIIPATGTLAKRGIADIADHVGIGELLRLDLEVQRRHRIVSPLA